MKRTVFVLGTRPEIIKMAPVIRLAMERKYDFEIVHSNQHYSREMDSLIFEQLRLPNPRYHLEVGSGTHGQQTARILERVEPILMDIRPDYVFVHGDVNTTLAATLAAKKLDIRVGHVESGLRSFDRSMPEEINRVLVDHISDDCFAPTEIAAKNLRDEGILEARIHLVGNTIKDICGTSRMGKLGMGLQSGQLQNLVSHPFFLATIHRQENTDSKTRLLGILAALDEIGKMTGCRIIMPLHPRTKKILDGFDFHFSETFFILPPQGYFEFLELLEKSKMVFTDSGGVQEEACLIGTKCVTIRENTERPETVQLGANVVAGVIKENIISAYKSMAERPSVWGELYEGKSPSASILDCIEEHQ